LLSLGRLAYENRPIWKHFVTVGAVFSNIYQLKILSYYNYKPHKHLQTHCVNFLHCLWKRCKLYITYTLYKKQ